MSMNTKQMINGYLFIMPWLIGFIYFYIRCLAMTVNFSVSDLTVGTAGGYVTSWVGLDNFVYAFREHGTFKQVLTLSMMNMIVDVPLIIFFSLFVAMLLNRKFKGRTIVRAIFFLPVILSSGAIVDTMQMTQQMMTGGLSAVSTEMASAATSYVNIGYFIELFEEIAIPGVILDYIIGAVSRINEIITRSGVQIVIFIAALQSIPGALYEVAKIEGATAYETFWKITFPMVMPHIVTNIVYTIVDNFSESEIVELAYNTAFSNSSNYGLSSAFSLISTIIVCGLLVLVCGFIQKRTFYYN